MLILTRRAGELFRIGDNVVVTICAINGNAVRFGVAAPRDVTVHREEVYQRIKQESERRP
jgi:carbon storage regulator